MKTVQIRFKTKNQIFNDFIGLTKTALDSFSIFNWEVRQLKQVYKVNHLKPTVFISIINKNQNGRQYYKKEKTASIITRKANSKQEVKIRFLATRRELDNDTLETYNASDVLEVIRSFMQSPEGIKYLAELGYAQYRAESINEMDFTNDSDNFQFLPQFDCTFLYTDKWSTAIPEITKVKEKIHGIYHI